MTWDMISKIYFDKFDYRYSHETWFLLIWDMIIVKWDIIAAYKIWLLFLYAKWDIIADNYITLVYDMKYDF